MGGSWQIFKHIPLPKGSDFDQKLPCTDRDFFMTNYSVYIMWNIFFKLSGLTLLICSRVFHAKWWGF